MVINMELKKQLKIKNRDSVRLLVFCEKISEYEAVRRPLFFRPATIVIRQKSSIRSGRLMLLMSDAGEKGTKLVIMTAKIAAPVRSILFFR